MSQQIPGSYVSDVPEDSTDSSLKERESQQNSNREFVAMKGSTSIGIPNPTGAKLVDTKPSPPSRWENKSPFDVNSGTEPWDGVKDDKPEERGPVIVNDSLPPNAAVQPQGEHHQQIRDGREAVKEPVDDVIGEARTTTSPEQDHSPQQNKEQELAALAALTGGQQLHDGDGRRPYSEEERAGRSLVERSHGDRLAREEQPEHQFKRATGQEYGNERERARHHEKEREQERQRKEHEHERQRKEHEHERQREKEREQARQRENEREERRREEERERQRAQQFKQQHELPPKGARDEHDRAHRATSESESSNEEFYHDTQEQQPTDRGHDRHGKKKSKASATVTKAMGTLKEKVGKLVHHEKTADKGTEQKMVGDTKKKLADGHYS